MIDPTKIDRRTLSRLLAAGGAHLKEGAVRLLSLGTRVLLMKQTDDATRELLSEIAACGVLLRVAGEEIDRVHDLLAQAAGEEVPLRAVGKPS